MAGNSRFAVSVHILAYLAYRDGAAVPSAEIAESVDTHPVVIRRLLSALVKAGLVTTHKGATGGFSMIRSAREISLRDIYQAVEPQPDCGMKHFMPNQKCPVGVKIETILHEVMRKAQASMEAELARVSLASVRQQLQSACSAKK